MVTIKIIQIGNSRGIRLPKKIIEEFNSHGEVEIELKKEGILIKNKKKNRNGWKDQIKSEIKRKEYPEVLIPDELNSQFEDNDREW